MDDLPLRQLRAFAALHETGGVRTAARRLGIAHSAVSRYVRELEQWLGVKLTSRSDQSRLLDFTAEGAAFGRALGSGFAEISQAVAALREGRRGNSVTIAATPSMAARWLLPRLPRLQDQAPWVELSVTIDQRVRDPEREGADLSLRMGKGPWPGLRCEPLMDETLFPVLARKRWEADGRPERFDYLARLPLLHDRDPHTPWTLWRARFGPAALNVRAGPRLASADLVLRAAAEGLGVALARGRLAEDGLKSGVLVRPFGEAAIALPDAYWLVRPAVQPDRSALSAVIAWLNSEAEALAG